MALKPMGPIEKAIWAINDLERQLKLIKEDLYAQLPKRNARKPKGYFIDHTGKRRYYLKNKRAAK